MIRTPSIFRNPKAQGRDTPGTKRLAASLRTGVWDHGLAIAECGLTDGHPQRRIGAAARNKAKAGKDAVLGRADMACGAIRAWAECAKQSQFRQEAGGWRNMTGGFGKQDQLWQTRSVLNLLQARSYDRFLDYAKQSQFERSATFEVSSVKWEGPIVQDHPAPRRPAVRNRPIRVARISAKSFIGKGLCSICRGCETKPIPRGRDCLGAALLAMTAIGIASGPRAW